MSFRNRCVIAGSNGAINLSVPVRGGREQRTMATEVLIDNRIEWQSNHWKSICSCYNHSPWLEYYKDSLIEIFEKRYEHLSELNMAAFQWTITQLKIRITWEIGQPPEDQPFEDLRNKLVPRKLATLPSPVVYRQVFEERIGFMPHLSVLDLLFCTGTRAREVLEKGLQ